MLFYITYNIDDEKLPFTAVTPKILYFTSRKAKWKPLKMPFTRRLISVHSWWKIPGGGKTPWGEKTNKIGSDRWQQCDRPWKGIKLSLYLFSRLISSDVCRRRPCWVRLYGPSSGAQPGWDFPTDLLVRGVVLGTQRFGTLTMLARGPSGANPPLLFPGRGQCNTSLPESHFPFLSNFHTPTPLSRCPTLQPRWRAPRKEDCGDMRKALFQCLPSLFPTFPPAVFRLFQARGLQTRSIRPFSCDGTLGRNVHFLKTRQLWPRWNLRNPATERWQWKMQPLFRGI